jgi:hypothetical protein
MIEPINDAKIKTKSQSNFSSVFIFFCFIRSIIIKIQKIKKAIDKITPIIIINIKNMTNIIPNVDSLIYITLFT